LLIWPATYVVLADRLDDVEVHRAAVNAADGDVDAVVLPVGCHGAVERRPDSGLKVVGAGHRVGVLPGLLGDLRTDLVGDVYPRVQGNA
jgi:hypothetical protein